MTTIEIILAIIAFAFVVLVVFLVRVLTKAFVTFKRVNHTLRLVQKQIQDLDNEPRQLIRNANRIASDVNSKMDYLNPLFGALANLGTALESRTANLNQPLTPSTPSSSSSSSAKSFSAQAQVNLESPNEDLSSDMINLVLTGLSVWQKIKSRRK